jgi:L-fucose isomerase-like protein
MLTILPLASALNPPDDVRASVARVSARLETAGAGHRIAEHLALAEAGRMTDPVILIAHETQNSLPAALEILSRLQQGARAGRIVLVNDVPGAADGLARVGRFRAVRRRLSASRLGRIGVPSDWLVASSPSPEVVRETWGSTVVDIPMAEVQDAMRSAPPDQVEAVRADLAGGARVIVEPSPDDLVAVSRVTVALREVVARYRLDACTVRCFDLVQQQRTTGCAALSSLIDAGITAGCEGDVPATLTMMWMAAMGCGPSFMANPQDLDPAANTLWLAHCTVARSLVSDYALRSHFESSLGVGIEGRLAPGPVTLARIGGGDLRALVVSDGSLLDSGDHPQRCRTQALVHLERPVMTLLERPAGNHHILARGAWADDLRAYHALFVQSEERD